MKKCYKSLFPYPEHIIYLNSGTHSIVPHSVLNCVLEETRQYESNPTEYLINAWKKIWTSQQKLALFLNANPLDIFLRQSVSKALNDFVLGISLPAQSEFLVTELEYGAIANLCRFKCESENLKLKTVKLPLLDERVSFEDLIISQLTPQTMALLVSHILTGTGHILDIQKIAKATRKNGTLLIVDGAHAPGSMELDFSLLADVDFYGGNIHKWMMGPKGSAFGWAPKRNHHLLKPTIAGWTTYNAPQIFQSVGQGDAFQMKMLESYSTQFAAFVAISNTIDFWNEIGKKTVFSRIKELQIYTEKAFAELLPELKRVSPTVENRGPLLTYKLPKELSKLGYGLMNHWLEKNKLQVMTPPVYDEHYLRLSPHIYNSENEIFAAVKIIAATLKEK